VGLVYGLELWPASKQCGEKCEEEREREREEEEVHWPSKVKYP
jgi:hypothetical protein